MHIIIRLNYYFKLMHYSMLMSNCKNGSIPVITEAKLNCRAAMQGTISPKVNFTNTT